MLCSACVNTIRYEYDLQDGQITILAQLSTSDTDHSVFLSMSYPDRIDSLPGATVNCYVNGTVHRAVAAPPEYEPTYDWQTGEVIMMPVRYRHTRYDFQAEFKPGDEVRIEASKDGMQAWAELVVPQPGTLVSVDTATVVKSLVYQDLEGSETYEQEYLEFTVRLRDVTGEDSYFTMNADLESRSLDYDTFHDLVLEDGYSSGLGDLFEDLLPVNSTHCFSDKMFRDGEVTVHLYFPTYYFNRYYYYDYYDEDYEEYEDDGEDMTFRLRLNSIDRGFYNYLRALNNMMCYGFDVTPIIEPTMLPNNVQGGMGMVSVAAESLFELTF